MDAHTFHAFTRELEKIATMQAQEQPGFWSAAKAPFVETSKLFRPSTAKDAWKDLWRGSSNVHPLNREFMQDDLYGSIDPKTGERTGGSMKKAIRSGGKFVDDIETAKGVRASLRRGGWLANTAKYEGPSTWRRGMNLLGRHLPGQRSLMVGGTALGLHSDLQKYDATGRERGAAERGLGATGGVVGSLGMSAPAAVRAMSRGGWAGTAGGLLGSAVLGMGGSMGGGYLGRKIDEARGFKPSAPPQQVTG